MVGIVFTLLQNTIFGIVLPTADIYGDINFSIRAFSSQHFRMGCLMLFPVLLNTAFNFYKWISANFDTETEKRFTWLLVVLNMWPQYQILKLLSSIFRGTSKNTWKPMQDKIKRQLSYIEPFVEAVPQFYVSIGVFSLLAVKRYQQLCLNYENKMD